MKILPFAVGIAVLAGCATSNRPAPDQFVGGEMGDLRVLLNDRCPEAKRPSFPGGEKSVVEAVTGFAGLSQQLISSIGGIAFQSFGQYLKHRGEANITRSVGSNGGMFYSTPVNEKEVTIEPRIRCMYLVRAGFSQKPSDFAREAPADLKEIWSALGLTRTPDLFASLHIETAGEADKQSKSNSTSPFNALLSESGVEANPFWNPAVSPPFFRLKLDRLYVRQFQSPDTANETRDLAFVFNYGQASTQTAVQAGGANAGVTELAGKFAVGGIRFAGVRLGDYNAASLANLQTAWMPVPSTKPYDLRSTVDISTYVAEFVPGNRLLEEIGDYLAGDQVRESVQNTIANELKPAPK